MGSIKIKTDMRKVSKKNVKKLIKFIKEIEKLDPKPLETIEQKK